jgi:Ca2+-binding RTX toxin-like protein
MNTRLLSRLIVFALVVLVLASVLTADAAANTVPQTRLTDQSRAITVNDLKPPECAGINLNNIVVCTGTGICSGTGGNDLILGTAGSDTGLNGRIVGGNGNDCILGGAGNDDLRGQGGNNDVCIGGPGNDTLNANCETRIQ